MIGIAAVVGAVSIFAADIWIKNAADARVESMRPEPSPAKPEVRFDTIVVAKEPLRYGMRLDEVQLAEIPWPQESLPEGAFTTVEAALAENGRLVLSSIAPNEPILLAKLSGPNGRASLSNRMTPGMRAVTVRTDEVAGVGGFISPGDRVDVVLTRDAGSIREVERNAKGAAGSSIATEIVVSHARVLSVGQGADESETAPRIAESVTLEVTPAGAQKVALARTVGTLSLSLISAGEGEKSGNGLTTISSFGGSMADAAEGGVDELFKTSATEPETPRFTTVVVTRGSTDPENYEVVSPGQ